MLTVTKEELEKNLEKYLSLARKENITITINGVPVAMLTAPDSNAKSLVSQLTGIIPNNGATKDEIREERLVIQEDYNGLMETLCLCAIPNMRQRIMEGLNAPIEDCVSEDENIKSSQLPITELTGN
ncbi:hypothetical protein [Anoxynatronum sibiricum]|uniref:Antitoxin n=1 Tax=Anoxynatronum sibiricum TaxID=210623 RepID=A0ABU9VX02_9CLOT